MGIRSQLILDHVFFELDNALFDCAAGILPKLPNVDHRTVRRPDITYEGIYLETTSGVYVTTSGVYVELLRSNPFLGANNSIGLAVCALDADVFDVRFLPEKVPELEWSTGDPVLDPENNPWYTFYLAGGGEPSGPHIWAMSYQNMDRCRTHKYRTNPPADGEFAFVGLLGAIATVPRGYLDRFRPHFAYLPCTIEDDGSRLTFEAGPGRFVLQMTEDDVEEVHLDQLLLERTPTHIEVIPADCGVSCRPIDDRLGITFDR